MINMDGSGEQHRFGGGMGLSLPSSSANGFYGSTAGSIERPRLRAPAFTDKEDEALIKTYFKYRSVIRGKTATGVSQRTRNDAWERVAAAVNVADGRYHRTVKSVKIHYGNMLAEYRAYKLNDKNARAFQDGQLFYRYFDELLAERCGGTMSESMNNGLNVESAANGGGGLAHFPADLFDVDAEPSNPFTSGSQSPNPTSGATSTANHHHNADNSSNGNSGGGLNELAARLTAGCGSGVEELMRTILALQQNPNSQETSRHATQPHSIHSSRTTSAADGNRTTIAADRREKTSSLDDERLRSSIKRECYEMENGGGLGGMHIYSSAGKELPLGHRLGNRRHLANHRPIARSVSVASRQIHGRVMRRKLNALRVRKMEHELEVLKKRSKLLDLQIIEAERRLNFSNAPRTTVDKSLKTRERESGLTKYGD